MSKKSTIVVAFPHGGIIPAGVLEKPANVSVLPHEPIEVPKFYGEHLISDRIAYDFVEAEKRKKADAASAARDAATASADAEALEKLRSENTRLTTDLEKAKADLTIAESTIAELKLDKVKLSGEIGSLQNDLKDANTSLETAQNDIATLTEQLGEATKPADEQQGSLGMENGAGNGKSK